MAVVFPTNDQFTALTKDGVPLTDPVGDESPASTDIVGTTAFPAFYFTTDSTHAFFRFRLRGNPTGVGGFDQFAWVVLFDTDNNVANSYEWEFALNGVADVELLKQNLAPNSPSPGWGDTAEGVPINFPIVGYDIARVVAADSFLGGVQNYFLDLSVELSVLRSTLGITDDTPLRFNVFTAANENNFNKDRLCTDFYACFSDPVTLVTIFSGRVVNKEDGSPICNAKVELFSGDTLIATTRTDAMGDYSFTGIDTGTYSLKITKCCFLPNCGCSIIDVKQNQNNIYNFSLAPDCICEIKCNIAETEKEILEEKYRIYKKVTDFFISTTPDEETLSRYLNILTILNKGTSELDCCIACVIENLNTCEGDDCNG